MSPAYLVEGDHLTAAYIADPALNRVVAFSSAPDGAAPEGPVGYRFRPTTRSHHLIANLAPNARYSLVLRNARSGELSVRLVPDYQGSAVVGPQGVLSFEIEALAAARGEGVLSAIPPPP